MSYEYQVENIKPVSELHKRGCKAAKRYLELNGYEILDVDFNANGTVIDIVADDEGTLVFVSVNVNDDFTKGFKSSELDRAAYEIASCHWLADCDDRIDCPVRFDRIEMNVLGNHRAMIRHHVNAFGSWC